jgi:hypothetical protein
MVAGWHEENAAACALIPGRQKISRRARTVLPARSQDRE